MIKKTLPAVILSLALSFNAFALDLSYSFEGGEEKRERLVGLQGEQAPEIMLHGWENSPELTLADLKGKIVVLDFWATWCSPCISSIPKNNKIADKFK
ncbi:MAG: TlpA disulfide reductase family protein, partial [Verrucomicrobiota bacterium]